LAQAARAIRWKLSHGIGFHGVILTRKLSDRSPPAARLFVPIIIGFNDKTFGRKSSLLIGPQLVARVAAQMRRDENGAMEYSVLEL
jgi:hypothetical protein